MDKETVIVRTAARTDRSGRPVGEPKDDPRPGCVVVPRRSAEGDQGRIVLSGWRVVFPKRSRPIPADAVLVVRGEEYELFGKVADYGPSKQKIADCRSTGETDGA